MVPQIISTGTLTQAEALLEAVLELPGHQVLKSGISRLETFLIQIAIQDETPAAAGRHALLHPGSVLFLIPLFPG